MKPLRVLPRRKRCSVHGCNNVNTHILMRTGDPSGAVYLCDDCLKDAYAQVIIRGDGRDDIDDVMTSAPSPAVTDDTAEVADTADTTEVTNAAPQAAKTRGRPAKR